MKNRMNTQTVFFTVTLLFGAFIISIDARAISGDSQSARLISQTAILDGVPTLHIGLYDGNDATVTSGELNSQDYWWTKFDAMMLDIALKQHQPEGRIGINLAIALRRVDDLVKKYPKHEEILKWKAHFEEVQSKISPDANRSASFGPQCPWDESNFAQLWVNFHWAKVAADQKDWSTALSCLQNVEQNYSILFAPDRMKNYPDDLRKWVAESKPEADKLYVTVKAKTGN
jgi:hypothetical protein